MPAREHRLEAGEVLSLQLGTGDELFCAAGVLSMQVPGGLAPALLHPGQGWRADGPVRVSVEALASSRCRHAAAPTAILAPSPAARPGLRPLRRLLGYLGG